MKLLTYCMLRPGQLNLSLSAGSKMSASLPNVSKDRERPRADDWAVVCLHAALHVLLFAVNEHNVCCSTTSLTPMSIAGHESRNIASCGILQTKTGYISHSFTSYYHLLCCVKYCGHLQ